jgi:hypothetical protein
MISLQYFLLPKLTLGNSTNGSMQPCTQQSILKSWMVLLWQFVTLSTTQTSHDLVCQCGSM